MVPTRGWILPLRKRQRRSSANAGNIRASAVIDGRRVIVHAPQIRSWENFEHFTAQVAAEFLEKDAAARYGVVELSGDTVVDLEERLVKVAKPKVDRITFTDAESSTGTGKPHPRGRRERTARNSARRIPVLSRGWRARNSAACRIQY